MRVADRVTALDERWCRLITAALGGGISTDALRSASLPAAGVSTSLSSSSESDLIEEETTVEFRRPRLPTVVL